VEFDGTRSIIVYDDEKIEFVSEMLGLVKSEFSVALAAIDKSSITLSAGGSPLQPEFLLKDVVNNTTMVTLNGIPLLKAALNPLKGI
jgi:hypothetical protein